MVLIKIDTTNLERLNKKIAKIDKRFKSVGIMQFGRAIAKKAVLELKAAYVPERAGQRTGRLESSIHAESYERGKTCIVSAYASNKGFPYAKAVEDGRGPIYAKKGYLRFIGSRGEEVFTKRVGPAEGKHFMAKAARWGVNKIGRYMQKRVQRIIQSGGTVDDYNIESIVV